MTCDFVKKMLLQIIKIKCVLAPKIVDASFRHGVVDENDETFAENTNRRSMESDAADWGRTIKKGVERPIQ